MAERSPGSADTRPPILVGGSARAGTHVVGRLISQHPDYYLIPTEARFHCADGGLADLVTGRTDFESFARLCLGPLWKRGLREHLGLQVLIERDRLEGALAELREGLEQDRFAAARRFAAAILDEKARAEGKRAWVEVSGRNIIKGPALRRIFPAARFVHMIRDGRAVTAAILQKRDTTDDRAEALGHWLSRVRGAHRAMRRLPPSAVIVVPLDDLVAERREETFERLVSFCGIGDAPAVRAYFDREISAERAHVGKWRERVHPADARWIERRYRRALRRLGREGITWLPRP